MADTRLYAIDLLLIDNFPGVPEAKTMPRATITASAAGHNAVAAAHPLGAKIQLRQSGDNGPAGLSTLMYAKLEEAHGTNKVVGAGIVCTLSGETALEPTLLSNDEGDIGTYASGMCAVSIAAVTENYYGWWWIGGVAPADQVAALRTTATAVTCLDEVTQGAALTLADAVDEDANGNIAFGLMDTDGLLVPCGVALKADHAA